MDRVVLAGILMSQFRWIRRYKMILRIIDKQTQLFLQDDFTFDEETEIGLNVEPAQGLYVPKWDGEKWIETGQAPEPTPQEPT